MATSYFPMTPVPSVSEASVHHFRRPSLTSSQAHAHAFGYTTTTSSHPAKYFPLPSPTDQSKLTSGALSTIPECPSSASGSASASLTSSRRSSHPSQTASSSVPLSSTKDNRPTKSTPSSPSKRDSHPYFVWTPGAIPPPIFDPDYPLGTPDCISPRVKTASSTGDSAKEYFTKPVTRRDGSSRPSWSRSKSSEKRDEPQTRASSAKGKSPQKSTSVLPTPPSSTRHTPLSNSSREPPLTVSELPLVHRHIGTTNGIFGHIVGVDPDGTHVLGAVPWIEMRSLVRRTRRDECAKLERKQKTKVIKASQDQQLQACISVPKDRDAFSAISEDPNDYATALEDLDVDQRSMCSDDAKIESDDGKDLPVRSIAPSECASSPPKPSDVEELVDKLTPVGIT
ncbi:hypothetical protein FRB99_000625 [Tulasnella sp. 403]|nr:hypothetical protein FRB99_000625 [Tulasnella sp. 403]